MNINNDNIYSLALLLNTAKLPESLLIDSIKLKSKNSFTIIEIDLYPNTDQQNKNHIYINDGLYNKKFPDYELINPEIIFNTETYLKIKLCEFVGEVNFRYTYFKNYYLQIEKISNLPVYSLISDFYWDNGRGKKGFLPSTKISLVRQLI
jgi:hypothetical protein